MQVLLARDAIVVDGRPVGKSHRLVDGHGHRGARRARRSARRRPATPRSRSTCATPTTTWSWSPNPPGLVVHSGAGHADGTLVNGLLALYPEMASVGDELRPGIVHRLDRDTSGLLVAARTAPRVRAASCTRSRREPSSAGTSRSRGARSSSPRGVIDAPIGRSTARRTRMAVRESGKAARTEYEVRTAFHDPGVRVARLPARDRPHASDPGAPERDRASDRGRRDLRRRARDDPARPAVPARRAARRSTSPSPASGSRSTTRCPPSSPRCSRSSQ